LRVTPQVKRRLDEAAEQSGRSQSQQAEFLLEQALDRGDLLREVLTLTFGKRAAGLLLLMGIAMQGSAMLTLFTKNRNPSDDWTSDPDAYREAGRAVLELWMLAKPSGEETVRDSYGLKYAMELVAALGRSGEQLSILDEHLPHSDAALALLGPIAERMTAELARSMERARKEVAASTTKGRKVS
jgi:hypothetical protein